MHGARGTAPAQIVNDEQSNAPAGSRAIPSVSPHASRTAKKKHGQAHIADYIAEVLRKLAFDVELREVEPVARMSSGNSLRVAPNVPLPSHRTLTRLAWRDDD